ncbi:IncV family inclusion membrane protein [Chlamydia vaughanii]|uniref:IncV family inclusion membrane protein n=1 Tax=Chlamydia vaughanii TaxID=3112552 RepID=UPI0032B18CBF
MSNSIDPLGQQPKPISKSQVPAPSGNIGSRIKATSKGFFGRLLSLPDRNPKMRYVFDVTIIAVAVITIVGVLVASQGQGLLLFGLVPGFVIGALGLTMLISDIANTPRAQKIADTITAVLLPFILLGIASALIAAAYFTAGGSALIFANPMFLMGFMTIGLSLISLSKVTFQHFKTQSIINEQKKIIEVSDQALHPEGTPSAEDVKRISFQRKRSLSAEAKRELEDREARVHTRRRRLDATSRGVVGHRALNQVENENPDVFESSSEEDIHFARAESPTSQVDYNPFTSSTPVPEDSHTGGTGPNPGVPFGTPSPVSTISLPNEGGEGRRVGGVSSSRSRDRHDEEHDREEGSHHGDDESSDQEEPAKQQRRTKRKKKKGK